MKNSGELCQQVYNLLEQAVSEGYDMAMKIRANYPEGLVGVAEVRAQQAQLVAKRAGEVAVAKIGWKSAIEMYEEALKRPEHLGNFSERNMIRYNYACCLAQIGEEERQRHAVELIQQLVEIGVLSMEEVRGDEDLAGIVSYI